MLKTRETRVEERKEEKRSEKRDRILRAAEAIFLDKGFHAASMNEIAEAADVSTPHLYNFYASKAALALAVQLKMGQETFDALKTAMSAGKKNPSCESIFDSRRSSADADDFDRVHAQSRHQRKDHGKRSTFKSDDF